MRLALLSAATLVAAGALDRAEAYAGEDLLSGAPFHHYDITFRALAGDAAVDGDQTGAIFAGLGFSREAAVAIAWHADYIDSYLYSPIWWAQGVAEDRPTQRIKASFSQYNHLINLHFDDTFSTTGISGTWRRYGAGTIAGLAWAAENNDVAAAHNILGVSVHAVQDFYSHSNWVDDPGRRGRTWLDTPIGERNAYALYSGSYELPRNASQRSHGKISFACSIYGRPEIKSVLDTMCTGLTPWAETSYCVTQRHCGSASTTAISVEGADVGNALVLDPPGIALDSSWLARADGPQRGVTNSAGQFIGSGATNMPDMNVCTKVANFGWTCDETTGQCTRTRNRACTSDSDRLFAASKLLAIESTMQWVDKIGQIMNARYPDFWRNVMNGGGVTSLANRTAQFENFSKVPFQFLSVGPYPVFNNPIDGKTFEKNADGYYVRLQINTANVANAGTDSDVTAILDYNGGSKEFLLDYMPTSDATAGMRANRLVAYNDFEQGDDTVYTIGPVPSAPTGVTLVNDSADAGDVFTALGDDIESAIEDAVDGLEQAALGIISGNADFTGKDTLELTYDQLTGGSGPRKIYINGADDGKYELRFNVNNDTAGLNQTQIAAGWRRFTVNVTSLYCQMESKWDRGSSADEPFAFFSASPLNGSPDATQYWQLGPYNDVDTGETVGINQSRSFILPRKGVVIFSMELFESDDESAGARTALFNQFKTGVEGGADPSNKKFLDALGRSLAVDWEVSRVRAYAFYRGGEVHVGKVLDYQGNVVIGGDERKRFAFSPTIFPIMRANESPDLWVASRKFAKLPAGGSSDPQQPQQPPQPPGGLTVDGGGQQPQQPSAPQGEVTIVASHSGKCADVRAGSQDSLAVVQQWSCVGVQNQKWRFQPVGGGYYTIVAAHSGKCMDVSGGSQEDGADIIQYDCHARENQQWRLNPMGSGLQIIARHSGKCLDVRGVSYDDGGPLHQWTCLGPQQGNQIFNLR